MHPNWELSAALRELLRGAKFKIRLLGAKADVLRTPNVRGSENRIKTLDSVQDRQ
jgi:hypothetical protein